MKRLIFYSILVLSLICLSSPAWAQQGAVASIGVHFPQAERGGNRNDDLGVNFAGGYWWNQGRVKPYLGVESFVNDGFSSRFRALGLAQIEYDQFKFDFGGGYYCFMRCSDRGRRGMDGGFGQLGVHYKRAHGFGRLGNDRFVEVEAALDVWSRQSISVQAFGRGTRHELPGFGSNRTQTVYPVGLRFIFAENK